MPCNPSTQLPQNHKTAPISTCVFLFFCHPQFNCSPTAELKAPESYIYQRGSPEQNALQHLFTSDSASSMADWISDSFCFFFSAEIPQNQTKTIDKSGGSRTNMKENQIKQGGLLTSIERGGGGALAGEGGRGLAVLPLVALEHLAHGCCSRLASIPFLDPLPQNPAAESLPATRSDRSDSAMSDRADGGGEFDEDCVRVGGGIGDGFDFDRVSIGGEDEYRRD